MAEKDKKDVNKDVNRETKPTGAGSQIGMGGSAGLGGSYIQGAGEKGDWSGASAGYENMPEKGSRTTLGRGTGSSARRSGEENESR